jgi:hypothetical protein
MLGQIGKKSSQKKSGDRIYSTEPSLFSSTSECRMRLAIAFGFGFLVARLPGQTNADPHRKRR